jgi:hypothetical protein
MPEHPSPIVQEVDFLLAERRELAAQGPLFKIAYTTRESTPELYMNSETRKRLLGISLVCRVQEYQLSLTDSEAYLFEYLSHVRLGQTATQIERGMRVAKLHPRTASLHRTTVKTYARRIREALTLAFRETGFPFDAAKVMTIKPTVGNKVLYAIHARVVWQLIPERRS